LLYSDKGFFFYLMITKRIKINKDLKMNVFDSSWFKKYETDLTVVFIHGGAGNLLNWKHQLDYFSEKYRTVAYDWRGCGDSDRVGIYTFEEHYQDFLSLLRKLNIPVKPILVGHSYGCLLARRYISEKPVGKFINVSLGLSSIEERWLKMLLILPKFLQRFLYRSFFLLKNPLFAKKLIASKKTPLHAIRDSMRANKRPPLEFFLGLKTFYENEPLDWIQSYQEKMLIVGGQDDQRFKPNCLEHLNGLLPQSKLEIIKDAGHIVPAEAPENFNNVLEAFIEAK